MDPKDDAAPTRSDAPAGLTTDAAPPAVIGPRLGPGAVIADRYHLEARLGAGGGGTVWRCHDQKLDAIVALKVVDASGDAERWRREVAMARRIADRNVCRVHDLGETAELRFVTMELVEGESLRTSVRPDLPAAQARALLEQVVSGAAAIHAAGIVHRDLKPENVVVARDGRAVIVDFGLAREPRHAAVDDLQPATVDLMPSAGGRRPEARPLQPSGATVTNAGVIVGTPRYMSPEQAAGDTVDARTDVWALALIGHELLTGRVPEPATDEARGGPTSLRSTLRIDPAADAKLPGIAAVLRRCLAVAPAQRFADARELTAALAELGRRRWPRRAAIAAVAAAALGGVVAAAALGGTSSPKPEPDLAAPTRTADDVDYDGSDIPLPPSHPAGPVELRKVMEPVRWPDDFPMTIAAHPDGKQYAYTRVGLFSMDLLVGSVDGKRAPEKWQVPKLSRPGDRFARSLVTIYAAGWFSDSSIALIGSTERDGFALFRVYRDGTSKLLHQQHSRFAVAVSKDDRVAIGVNDDGIFTLGTGDDAVPDQLVQLGRGEQVIALAWSPDAKQLAAARLPASATEPSKIQIISDTGDSIYDVWSGRTAGIYDTMLVWLDDRRIAFTQHAPVTRSIQLYSLDVDNPADLRERASWTDEYVGIGTAARDTVLVMRGTAYHSVQVGDEKAQHLSPVQAGLRGSYLSGWTTDGRVVFAAGEPGKLRVARARPGRDLEYWPGTKEGDEVPHSVVGDGVIVHRIDPKAVKDRRVVIERIGPRGERTELARVHADTAGTPVRCAGDRAGPCVIAELRGNQVAFRELDPERGTLGEVIHQRPIGERYKCDLALSLDGTRLAVVEGKNEVTLYDRATGTSKSWIASNDAALQSVGFSAAGDLWATSIGFRGRLFGLMEFPRDDKGGVKRSAHARGRFGEDALRWFWRPSPSPDGKQVAVTVREFRLHIAQITGL